MLTIEYDPDNGMAVRDGECEQLAATYAYNASIHKERLFSHSTANIFYAVRLLVQQGQIDYHEIQFLYKGQYLVLNEYGVPQNWPVGFLDFHGDYAQKLILGGIAMRKAKRQTNANT